MTVAEQIHAEAQRLPEDMAAEVLDFIVFLKKRRGLVGSNQGGGESEPITGQVDWDSFFRNFSRPADDPRPFSREEIYAERLR